MGLKERLQERWHCELEAIQVWETEPGTIGVYRSKPHGSISLVIALEDAMVIYTYASVQSALEDARIIADVACAW